MIRAGIIGSTGYTGGELLRILVNHPRVKIKKASSRSNQGSDVILAHPSLMGSIALIEDALEIGEFQQDLDVLFLALPHGLSAEIVRQVDLKQVKVIDLGADFRLRDPADYQFWYQKEHESPWLLSKAVYGLPEIYRYQIQRAGLIANPGCYPTSALLGLAPLLKNKLINMQSIIVDSKSGISGAGKTLSQQSHFPDMNENLLAYKVGNHRHMAEMEQEMVFLADQKVKLTFTPHLIPVNRGIFSTIYVDLQADFTQQELEGLYRGFYQQSPFVRIRNLDFLPQTKWVQGSNYCDILPVLDQNTGRVTVLAVIDNLVKGAAGQAIQNMNLMFGFAEDCGLQYAPLYP